MKIGDKMWAIVNRHGELYSTWEDWPLQETKDEAEREVAFLNDCYAVLGPFSVVRVRLVAQPSDGQPAAE